MTIITMIRDTGNPNKRRFYVDYSSLEISIVSKNRSLFLTICNFVPSIFSSAKIMCAYFFKFWLLNSTNISFDHVETDYSQLRRKDPYFLYQSCIANIIEVWITDNAAQCFFSIPRLLLFYFGTHETEIIGVGFQSEIWTIIDIICNQVLKNNELNRWLKHID